MLDVKLSEFILLEYDELENQKTTTRFLPIQTETRRI
jgi:hypothetical protein